MLSTFLLFRARIPAHLVQGTRAASRLLNETLPPSAADGDREDVVVAIVIALRLHFGSDGGSDIGSKGVDEQLSLSVILYIARSTLHSGNLIPTKHDQIVIYRRNSALLNLSYSVEEQSNSTGHLTF